MEPSHREGALGSVSDNKFYGWAGGFQKDQTEAAELLTPAVMGNAPWAGITL